MVSNFSVALFVCYLKKITMVQCR